MKKFLLLIIACSFTAFAFAKKVKFSVDMTGVAVSVNGVHVMGDFQKLAGYPADWASDATELTKEGSTDIYSIEVNIPAGAKYEYRFINGDQGYESEFVPDKSRLIHPDFDNRWIFIDSLDNSTYDIGAIKFAQNAPTGKFLLRFKVDMRKQMPIDLSNSANRPHVEGSFQNWNPNATALYAPNDTVYEFIAYVTAGTYQFKYVNGNTSAKVETVPSACAVSGNRTITVSSDTVLENVCFASCTSCTATGILEQMHVKKINVFPNPSSDYTTLRFEDGDLIHTVSIRDISGKTIRLYDRYNKAELIIEREQLDAGIYFITSQDSKKNVSTSKWIVQ
jgi:alpha-amylase